jgi:hypothetical protein
VSQVGPDAGLHLTAASPRHPGHQATLLPLPGGSAVYVATQLWALDRWTGAPDPPGLPRTWARKPAFTVRGAWSCAELAILDRLRDDGWQGVWVNAFAGDLRSEWFPAPVARTLTEVDAPAWAADVFDQLRAANGGKLGRFFDVFA